MPKTNAFIGKSLDTCSRFRCLQPIPMIDDDRRIEPFLYDKYLIINNHLYELDEQLVPVSISNDELKNNMHRLLQSFIALNNFTWMNNRLVPLKVFRQEVGGEQKNIQK